MFMTWERWICLAGVLLLPLSAHAVMPMIAANTGSLFLNSDGSVWGTGQVTGYSSGATSPVPLLQLSNVIAVEAGPTVEFALLADGSLWGSGQNYFGELADPAHQYRATPQRIPGLSDVKAVSAGGNHVLALRNDGTVWAWGANEHGQLGDGTQTSRDAPVQVIGLTEITRISASKGGSLALKSDGTVWVWGSTCCGAAGNGVSPTTNDLNDPEAVRVIATQVHNLDQVIAIAAGESHHMALRADRTVWTWGRDGLGQNGLGSVSNSPLLPVQIPNLDQVIAIQGKSTLSSLALKADGTVWAWGSNNAGQLGVSDITYSAVPIQVPGLADIVSISAGQTHTLAMRRDGAVYAWGSNSNGQLGDGTLQDRSQPLLVVGPGGTEQLSLAQPAPSSFNKLPSAQISLSADSGRAPLTVQAAATGAADPDGTVVSFTWKTGDGQQAAGPSATFVFTQAGDVSIHLLVEDNAGGRGTASQVVSVSPAIRAAVSTTPKVCMGLGNSIALTNDGRIFTWGKELQIGLYDPAARLLREYAESNSVPIANGITGAVDIACGHGPVFTLFPDGTALAWGYNPDGQVGTGTVNDLGQPQPLPNLPPVQTIAAGGLHTLALTRDGRVFSWGSNIHGQLGLGDYQNRFQPTEIPGSANVVAVAGGYGFSVALTSDGTVWSWGDNSNLQLGDGTNVSRDRPAIVEGLSDVTKIFATSYAFYAQKADGTVWAAGDVPLRSPFDTPAPGPQHIPALDNVAQIAGGGDYIIVRKADGTVWTAGRATSLALGFSDGGDVQVLRQIPGIPDAIWVAGGQFAAIVVRHDGTVLTWGGNLFGALGDGTLALQLTPVLVLSETANGFLDLIPEVANTIPQDKIPPFFLATYANGGLSSTTLYADVKGLTPGGAFASGDPGRFAAGYNVYVAASVPSLAGSPYFQLGSNNAWSTLSWPMAQFMSSVALESQNNVVRAQILENADLSSPLFAGTSVLVGYGTDPDEMLRAGRYRTIFTVTQP